MTPPASWPACSRAWRRASCPPPSSRAGLASLSGVHLSSAYGSLAAGRVPDPEPDGATAHDAFRRAGYRLLEALLAQKGSRPAAEGAG